MRQHFLHLIIVVGRAASGAGRARWCNSCQLIDHYSFIFLLHMKLLRRGGLVGTGLYVTHRWNLMVLVPLVQILQTGVERSAHGSYYIFTRTITPQEVIVTVSAVCLWLSQDMKSNAQICNVHQIHPLFCVKTFVLL